jgi:hypothetical protein
VGQAYVVLQPVSKKSATVFQYKIPIQAEAPVLRVELPVNLEVTSFIYRIIQAVLPYFQQVEQLYLLILL